MIETIKTIDLQSGILLFIIILIFTIRFFYTIFPIRKR
jgi:hypothetical protein